MEIELETKFTLLAGLRFGPKTGVPVLALHGWLDNAASFLPLSKHLNHVDLVAIDLPGHGRSAHRSSEASYLFVDWAREVFAAADALQWKTFHLLGHSMGAGISALCAAADPTRVKSFAALDGFMPVSDEPDSVVSRLKDYVQGSLKQKRAISFATKEEAFTARKRAGQFEEAAPVEAMMARNLKEAEGRWALQFDRRLMLHNPLRFTLENLESIASAIEVPVQVVLADSGLAFVKEQIARLGPHVKQITTDTVPGFHHAHLDRPEEVALVLNRFFASLRK